MVTTSGQRCSNIDAADRDLSPLPPNGSEEFAPWCSTKDKPHSSHILNHILVVLGNVNFSIYVGKTELEGTDASTQIRYTPPFSLYLLLLLCPLPHSPSLIIHIQAPTEPVSV